MIGHLNNIMIKGCVDHIEPVLYMQVRVFIPLLMHHWISSVFEMGLNPMKEQRQEVRVIHVRSQSECRITLGFVLIRTELS